MKAKSFWYCLGSINAWCAGILIGHTIKFVFGLETCSAVAAFVVMHICVYEITELKERARP